ncbi:Dynamitin-domain-containing protein, partial [Dimargaris cristalligena]
QESSYISQLEKRIADLESLLGLTSASSDPNQLQGRGILFVMQDLESKVKLLAQPHHLDGLSRRTKVLTQELEKLAAARARTENSSHLDDEVLEKINTLFGLVGKIDPLIDTVPSVVARLQSLQSLHLDASLVSQNLRQCTQEQTKFGEDTKALLDISNQLQDNIRTNTATIQSNVESLDVRITDLVQRAEKLKAP